MALRISRGRKSGFSLVEVMVGAALLGVAVISGIEVYIENQRFSNQIDLSSRAWYIAIQEIESLRRMHYTDVQKMQKDSGGYYYTFKGVDTDGDELTGKRALESFFPSNLLSKDGYKKEHFNPMGIKEGSVVVYLSRIPTVNGDKDWGLFARVVVSFKSRNNQVIGGDKNLNGVVDSGDSTISWHGKAILDSPVSVETVLVPVI